MRTAALFLIIRTADIVVFYALTTTTLYLVTYHGAQTVLFRQLAFRIRNLYLSFIWFCLCVGVSGNPLVLRW